MNTFASKSICMVVALLDAKAYARSTVTHSQSLHRYTSQCIAGYSPLKGEKECVHAPIPHQRCWQKLHGGNGYFRFHYHLETSALPKQIQKLVLTGTCG
ncbi:hypothetical protein Pelo_8431 [Pelomyxa schiedti]|nr:hypothetical protein Pelo_8431 [Pelomyxa schiedti]